MTVAAAMAATAQHTSAGFPRVRQGVIRCNPSSTLAQVAVTEDEGQPFNGEMLLADLGPIRVCRIEADEHVDGRMRHHHAFQDTPFYKLVFQLRGTVHLEQSARRMVLRAGDWSIYDVSKPYSMCNVEPLQQLAILLPKDTRSHALAQMLRHAPDQPFALAGMGQVLLHAAQSALGEAGHVEDGLGSQLGDTLLDLTKLALVEKLGQRRRFTVRDTWRERIETFVLRNLRDQELTVDSIAEALHCSKRYLHKAFSESGATLNQFIWDSRLERCRRDLESIELSGQSITEIAFGWGFINSAHFSRAFRNKFGLSPRVYRSNSLGQRLAEAELVLN